MAVTSGAEAVDWLKKEAESISSVPRHQLDWTYMVQEALDVVVDTLEDVVAYAEYARKD